MSEPRIISPLLDGFALGHSMSYHSGVNCYPAMRVDSDERYIIKTISIPASQTQLEALLLTGAYPSAEAARDYYKDLAKGILDEIGILEKLSQQRGFLPFAGHQTVPMEEGVGYEVYMVSHYRRSLERYLKRSPMTHLSAVNMGIDLCAALSVAREAGYLYVDLKPSNIYLGAEQEYHIGDLGFISMDSLKYASLPDRCRSAWTPPEITDAFAELNTTMDTYALGLVLYQVYNNGALPFDSEESRRELMQAMEKGEPMPAPAYADYEMAQIILKAIAHDPAERWADPSEMGHALIAYMQRNGANDVDIGPASVRQEPVVSVEEPAEESSEEVSEETETVEPEFEEDGDLDFDEEPSEETGAEEEQAEAPAQEDSWIDRMDAILSEDSEESGEEDPDAAELRRILSDDDTDGSDLDGDDLSEETADILSQADELIAHEAPEPAVAPEPIDIPIPEPIVLEDEDEEDVDVESEDPDEDAEDAADEDAEEEAEDDEEEEEERPGCLKRIFKWLLILLIMAGIAAGSYYFVTEYYLQTVEAVTASGEGTEMTVNVVTEMDQSLLSVVCVDLYGNKQTAPLTDGTATFTGLSADTQYNISLEVVGLHRLIGQTTTQFYTLPQCSVSDFTAITGPEDGSVILSFTAEGPAISSWILEYGAEGEAPIQTSFTGTTLTVTGLTIGSTYTFTLSPADQVYLVGQTELTFTASAVVYAQELSLTGDGVGSITATWTAPEGAAVESWNARCYNEGGYDQALTVTDTTVTFSGIDPTLEYTVEITAANMTQSTRTYVTANPITISNITASEFGSTSMTVTWEYSGTAPEGGWLMLYTVDGGAEQHVVQCDSPLAVIDPAAPGCTYDITIQAANAVSVFGGTSSIEVAEAKSFAQFGITADKISLSLCKLPADAGDWDYTDVSDDDVTSTFAIGDSAGIMLHTTSTYNVEYTTVPILFVIRDADGTVCSIDSTSSTWDDLWLKGHCDLSIPALPADAGSYTLSLYINGQSMGTLDFTMQ